MTRTNLPHFARLRCPDCGTVFPAEVMESTGSGGAVESDLCYHGSGTFAYPYFIAVCPGCRSAAYIRDYEYLGEMPPYSPYDPIGQWLAAFIKEQRQLFPGTLKYEMAARAYINRGAPALTVAYLYLRGSWCARHSNDRGAERRCQTEALRWFEEALAQGFATEVEAAIVTYLIAELNRRLGRFEEAIAWFKRMPASVPSWLARGVREMRDLAEQGIASPCLLPR